MGQSENLDFLDAITMIGFLAQLENMDKDEEQTSHINQVIKIIFNEIKKLHYENDLIMDKLDFLISLSNDKDNTGLK